MEEICYLDQLLLGRTIATPRELAELIRQYEAERGKMSRHRKIAIRNYLNFLVKKGYYRKSQVIDYYPLLELDRGGIRPASLSRQMIKYERHTTIFYSSAMKKDSSYSIFYFSQV